MASKIKKTNVMRVLDTFGIDYEIHDYDNKDNMIDGLSVAKMIGKDANIVFKTIVTKGNDGIFVFVLPVNQELDLKKCARSVKQKRIELINFKQIMPLTGYIKGGCSPIGMKKKYTTVFDITAKSILRIIFNAGKVGLQVELDTKDLVKVIDCQYFDICS